MLTLVSWPQDWSPAASPLRYAFSGTADGSAAEITFTDAASGALLGVRTVVDFGPAETDAACFVRRGLDPRPSPSAGCSLHAAAGRTLRLSVVCGSARAHQTDFAACSVRVPPGQAQTLPAVRTLAPGEWDEASVLVAGGPVAGRIVCLCPEAVTVELPELDTGPASAVLKVDYDDLCARLSAAGADPSRLLSASAVIVPPGVEPTEFIYAPARRAAGSVRLCWLSSRGAVEYHTFARSASEGIEILRVRTPAGMRPPLVQARRTVRVVSDYLPPVELERLSEAAVSPLLWRIAGSECVPVSADAGSLAFRTDGLCRLEFTVRDLDAAGYAVFGEG